MGTVGGVGRNIPHQGILSTSKLSQIEIVQNTTPVGFEKKIRQGDVRICSAETIQTLQGKKVIDWRWGKGSSYSLFPLMGLTVGTTKVLLRFKCPALHKHSHPFSVQRINDMEESIDTLPTCICCNVIERNPVEEN